MKRSSLRAMTLTESLAAVAIATVLVGLLAGAMLPNVVCVMRGESTQTLSNMKQLHLAAQQMDLDRTTTGDTSLPTWTCRGTNPLSFGEWTNALVKERYLTQADLEKYLSATSQRELFWVIPIRQTLTNVVNVFAVTEEDPSDTLLFATRNWRGFSNPVLAPGAYPTNCFVVFRKGGDGAILLPRQSTATNQIGAGGLHNYLPLR